MSSLTNNTTNRISSSSITTSNNTYPQSSSFNNNNSINTANTTNDCDGSISSSSSTTTSTLGLAAMGLAASLAAATNSDNTECDSKHNVSTPFKLHSNISDDPYASFYALNRTLPPSVPQPSSTPTGTLPFNIINQSPNNNLQFVSNPTGLFLI